MSINLQLLEAVDKLRTIEQEEENARKNVAQLLKIASSTQPVAAISRITGIKRTTIYYLISKYVSE